MPLNKDDKITPEQQAKINEWNRSPVGRLTRIVPFLALGYLGFVLYSCTANSLSMTFNDLNNADRCLNDVIENKGKLRLPLPAWNDGAEDKALYFWANGTAVEKAALITPDIISRCETLTAHTRNPEWDKLLALRPQ